MKNKNRLIVVGLLCAPFIQACGGPGWVKRVTDSETEIRTIAGVQDNPEKAIIITEENADKIKSKIISLEVYNCIDTEEDKGNACDNSHGLHVVAAFLSGQYSEAFKTLTGNIVSSNGYDRDVGIHYAEPINRDYVYIKSKSSLYSCSEDDYAVKVYFHDNWSTNHRNTPWDLIQRIYLYKKVMKSAEYSDFANALISSSRPWEISKSSIIYMHLKSSGDEHAANWLFDAAACVRTDVVGFRPAKDGTRSSGRSYFFTSSSFDLIVSQLRELGREEDLREALLFKENILDKYANARQTIYQGVGYNQASVESILKEVTLLQNAINKAQLMLFSPQYIRILSEMKQDITAYAEYRLKK